MSSAPPTGSSYGESVGAFCSTFRLLAEIVYKNGETEQYPLDFSTCTDEWQYASLQFSKAQYRAVESLTVVCDYSHNFGTACFDNVCLVRDSIAVDLDCVF